MARKHINEVEFTCDQCGAKESMPGSEVGPPRDWYTVETRLTRSTGTKSSVYLADRDEAIVCVKCMESMIDRTPRGMGQWLLARLSKIKLVLKFKAAQ